MSDPKVEPTKKPKSKSSRSKQASSSNAPKLKVVIRRLPPNLPETIFWQSVGQWVTEETVPWKLYVKGKLRSKPNKENIPSRAYVEFLTPEAVVAFNRDYNGHVFRDKQGNESAAVVEYAPFQKVPHPTRKMDSKVGTIETDEDFISFINALNKPAEPTPDVMNLATHAVAATEPTSTPLLDALKAAKESSTIKGYHSHYRDQANPPRTRAQQLDDEQTYNRKAPLLPKSQTDQDYTPNLVEPVVKDAGKGKEKEREGGGGGGKKKNKQKATTAAGPTSPGPSTQSKPTPPHMTKQTPQLQAPPSPSATRASTAEPPRPRPVVGIGARGGILAALGAATDARTTGASRKTSGRHREVSGGTSKTETPSVAQPPTTPLPAGVLAIPSSSIAPAASGGSATPSAPGKNRRGGKNRGRGAGGGGGEASINSSHTEMPRIDDPGQDLPPSAPAQRGRGGSGRSRGGRGRGRGRGGATGGGAGDQPSAPTG